MRAGGPVQAASGSLNYRHQSSFLCLEVLGCNVKMRASVSVLQVSSSMTPFYWFGWVYILGRCLTSWRDVQIILSTFLCLLFQQILLNRKYHRFRSVLTLPQWHCVFYVEFQFVVLYLNCALFEKINKNPFESQILINMNYLKKNRPTDLIIKS